MPLTPTERQLAPPCDGLQWGIFGRARSREKVRRSERRRSHRDPTRRDALPRAFTNSRASARNWMTPPPGPFFRCMFFRHFTSQESTGIFLVRKFPDVNARRTRDAAHRLSPAFLPRAARRGYERLARSEASSPEGDR